MMDHGTRKRSERKTEADAQNAEIRQRKALCGTNQRTTVCPQQGGYLYSQHKFPVPFWKI